MRDPHLTVQLSSKPMAEARRRRMGKPDNWEAHLLVLWARRIVKRYGYEVAGSPIVDMSQDSMDYFIRNKKLWRIRIPLQTKIGAVR